MSGNDVIRKCQEIDVIRKCQEIDVAGAMHRFGDMGVWRIFCKTE